jgi:hypothetical protein
MVPDSLDASGALLRLTMIAGSSPPFRIGIKAVGPRAHHLRGKDVL